MPASQVKGDANVIMISETKLDDAFPADQFVLECFSKLFLEGLNKSCRVDHNRNGGCILLFVGEDIPARLISIEQVLIETFFIELDLRKKKWIVSCSYNPHKKTFSHLEVIRRTMDIFIPSIMIILFFSGISMQM